MYHKIAQTADFIQRKAGKQPKLGLILGSGLGDFADRIENPIVIPYAEIPNFHETTVEGHEGRLILGEVSGVQVIVQQGRLHGYEGLPMEEVVFPVRVMATLGIEKLLLTNASGGINLDYKSGQLVKIEEHINLMGTNPMVGPNHNDFGPRFPDMTEAYNKELRSLLTESAKELGVELKKGVYAGVLGPTYETPAEIKMLRTIGADMVGMSTVPECIAAHHMGVQVAAVSCVTNMAAGIENEKLDHADIKDQAAKVMHQFSELLIKFVSKIK